MYITQEEFDRRLLKKVSEMSANEIFDLNGVYEIVSEYLNNEILDDFEQDQE